MTDTVASTYRADGCEEHVVDLGVPRHLDIWYPDGWRASTGADEASVEVITTPDDRRLVVFLLRVGDRSIHHVMNGELARGWAASLLQSAAACEPAGIAGTTS